MPTETAAGRGDRAAATETHVRRGSPTHASNVADIPAPHARLTRRLDESSRAAHSLSLAEYDALLQLAEAPGRRLRMRLLADRVLL